MAKIFDTHRFLRRREKFGSTSEADERIHMDTGMCVI